MASRIVRSTTVLLAATALLAAAAGPLAAQTRPIYVRPGAPGEPTHRLSQQEIDDLVPDPDAPGDYTQAEVEFVQNMIPHHAQAVTMSNWALEGRGESEKVETTAWRIRFSQENEIAQMTSWLERRDEEVPDPEHDADHDMPGMISPEDLAELGEMEGREFDLRFLELMIPHHQGAITMIDNLRDAVDVIEPELSVLTVHMRSEQSTEIGRLQFLQHEIENNLTATTSG